MLETHDEAGVTLRWGFVTAIDETNHTVRVWLPDLELETWWLQVPTAGSRCDKHYALPDIDEHVVCLLDRRGEVGVVLGSVFGQRDAVPVTGGADRHHIRYRDGTTIDYDRRTHRLALSVRGPVELVADGPVTVAAPSVTLDSPQVTVTGHLTAQSGLQVNGPVAVDGSIDATGSIMDAGGNSNHHSH
ncbi:phage baseplate assembly protein V [Caldimonas manganoxidans]|uniref:phage baseplate assembly protein V n=1 Tax=Caldimonas manganoxidans TaxID=196015 RepID=UPI00035F1535|nr:phage baseplate assembly protein V [Caldimonas manganoxidans]